MSFRPPVSPCNTNFKITFSGNFLKDFYEGIHNIRPKHAYPYSFFSFIENIIEIFFKFSLG